MKGFQIVFSGTDGAGKSTQILLLSRYLDSQELDSCVVWSRGGYTPLFECLKKMIRLLCGKRIPASGHSSSRDRLMGDSKVSRVWYAIAVLDLCIFYGVYIRWLKFSGKIVICDRYLSDTRVDFERKFSFFDAGKSRLWKLLEAVAPGADLNILLIVPPELSQKRAVMKNDPFADDLETLNFRYGRYCNDEYFGSSYIRLNATEGIQNIHGEIVKNYCKHDGVFVAN